MGGWVLVKGVRVCLEGSSLLLLQKMLIGQHGQVIGKIATEAGYDLMNAFLCEVQLKLSVQLKE